MFGHNRFRFILLLMVVLLIAASVPSDAGRWRASIAWIGFSRAARLDMGWWGGYYSPFLGSEGEVYVKGFQMDLRFDPTVLRYTGISYVSPFEPAGSPDLSGISSGLLQDIGGTTANPSSGHVDLADLSFEYISGVTQPTTLTFFAGPNDYVVGFDPLTQKLTTYGYTDIETAVTPEPGGLVALGTGLMGLAGMIIRRRR